MAKTLRFENQDIYILHSYPFKESSLIVDIFSKNYGRISAVAKGARRPHSSLRGMLQSFQRLEANWSGSQELKTLNSIEWSSPLNTLKGDALVCGFYINELLLRLLPKEDPHEELFNYYDETIRELAQLESLDITLRQFELRLLKELGYEVMLSQDNESKPIQLNQIYAYEAGSGPTLNKKNGYAQMVSGQTLYDMAQNDFTRSETQKQSKQLMRYLIAFYLGDKPLNSKKLFSQLGDA